MGKNILDNAKRRYTRLMEAEAIVLDVYEVFGNTVPKTQVAEYKKDLRTVLNVIAHYKHREVSTITNLNDSSPVATKSNEADENDLETEIVTDNDPAFDDPDVMEVIEEEVEVPNEVKKDVKNSVKKSQQPQRVIKRTIKKRSRR
jgi:outer membrane biosynthesis protein TonB